MKPRDYTRLTQKELTTEYTENTENTEYRSKKQEVRSKNLASSCLSGYRKKGG